VTGLAVGAWRVTWIDPYATTPTVIAASPATAIDDSLTLPIPSSSRDVALRLDRP